jgi:hypothetical protein
MYLAFSAIAESFKNIFGDFRQLPKASKLFSGLLAIVESSKTFPQAF